MLRVARGARGGLCCWPRLCPVLGPLERLCLELLLCREEGRGCRVPTPPPPARFNSVLWRAGEELFSMFLCFPLCLFFFFFFFGLTG